MATVTVGFGLWKDGRFWRSMSGPALPRIGEEIVVEDKNRGWVAHRVEGIAYYPEKQEIRLYVKEIR